MDIDLLWIVIGLIILVIGIVGCVLPVIPGQVLSWGSLLILQLTSPPPFTAKFIVVWALITAGVTLLDYYVPIWGTKKLGGSKKGIWGATFGLIVGIFFFPPFGLIIGPFVGAYIGELAAGKNSNVAFKSGLGSFLGFVAGTMMKLTISFIMGYYFITNAFNL
ncbi:MAG: DUF456 domain-containing protein [Bacteroidales bacterium]|nr:DUF456 domain-containing protein [Bacteroidales bacterium]